MVVLVSFILYLYYFFQFELTPDNGIIKSINN